jgi:hypothetical protein
MSDATKDRSQLGEALRAFRAAFKQAYALCEISRRIDKPLSQDSAERITRRINDVLHLCSDAWASYEPVRATIQGLSGRKVAFELVWDFLSSIRTAIEISIATEFDGVRAGRIGELPSVPIQNEAVASQWPMVRGYLQLMALHRNIDRAKYLKLCQRIEAECDKAKRRVEMTESQ